MVIYLATQQTEANYDETADVLKECRAHRSLHCS